MSTSQDKGAAGPLGIFHLGSGEHVCEDEYTTLYVSYTSLQFVRDFYLQKHEVDVIFPIPEQSRTKNPGH